MDNIEISHRTKNGSIIAKFSDRPSRDDLFTKKVNLKGIATADLVLGGDEHNIFINESLIRNKEAFIRGKAKVP